MFEAGDDTYFFFFLRFPFGSVVSLLADDDTLALHAGKGSFSNGSPNLIVGNVPSGSQRAPLPHLSSPGWRRSRHEEARLIGDELCIYF